MRVIVLGCILLSLSAGGFLGMRQQEIPETWYEVWAAYLKEKYPDAPRLVVASHLYPARIHGGIPGVDTLSSALREAVEDRRADPPMGVVIDDPLALGGNVFLLSGDGFARLSDGTPFEQWQAFHLRFPRSQGMIHLHAVGFSNDSTTAVFEAGRYWGPLACRGGGVVMVFRGGIWHLAREDFVLAWDC